tara:strand:- start:867 stop:1412 length:546 start_codon:yes stop_codon:yes gene_type:complete
MCDDILNELTYELVNLKWNRMSNKKYGRKSLNVAETPDDEPDRFYWIAGLVRDWSMRAHNGYKQSLVISKPTSIPKHQRAIELANKFMDIYDPSFSYTSIQFSRCMLTPKHTDKNNVGNSIIVGISNYEGGALNIHHGEEIEEVDIYRKPYMFDAGNTYHSTGNFSNDRITITYYTVKDFT